MFFARTLDFDAFPESEAMFQKLNRQWEDIEAAAQDIGCFDRLHIWPDPELRGYVDEAKLDKWLYKPAVEKWDSLTSTQIKAKATQVTYRKKSKTTTASRR